MNQINWVAIIGAIAAGVLSIMTAVTGDKNHSFTHERIDGIEENVVPREEIDARFVDKDVIVKNQTRHTDQIKELVQDVSLLKGHTHSDPFAPPPEEVK